MFSKLLSIILEYSHIPKRRNMKNKTLSVIQFDYINLKDTRNESGVMLSYLVLSLLRMTYLALSLYTETFKAHKSRAVYQGTIFSLF